MYEYDLTDFSKEHTEDIMPMIKHINVIQDLWGNIQKDPY